jgi:heterodisulfide reductase subunit C
MSSSTLTFEPEIAQSFADEVMVKSGQNLLSCYQCRRCAAGCPVGDESGVTPDRLIRMILLGEREEAIKNLLVWRCVACYTCGTRCPNNIHTARITESLKQMSKKGHLEPLIPKVYSFHHAFITSAGHFGRLNELEFMGLFEMDNAKREKQRGGWKAVIDELKSQAKIGMAMMKNRRMHFKFEKVKGLNEVKRLYEKSTQAGGGK